MNAFAIIFTKKFDFGENKLSFEIIIKLVACTLYHWNGSCSKVHDNPISSTIYVCTLYTQTPESTSRVHLINLHSFFAWIRSPLQLFLATPFRLLNCCWCSLLRTEYTCYSSMHQIVRCSIIKMLNEMVVHIWIHCELRTQIIDAKWEKWRQSKAYYTIVPIFYYIIIHV